MSSSKLQAGKTPPSPSSRSGSLTPLPSLSSRPSSPTPPAPSRRDRFDRAIRKAVAVRCRVLKRKLTRPEFVKLRNAVRKQIDTTLLPGRAYTPEPPTQHACLPHPSEVDDLKMRIDVLNKSILFLRSELASMQTEIDPFQKIVNYAVADIKAYGCFVVPHNQPPTEALLAAISDLRMRHVYVFLARTSSESFYSHVVRTDAPKDLVIGNLTHVYASPLLPGNTVSIPDYNKDSKYTRYPSQ
jgi:hypothetical protein